MPQDKEELKKKNKKEKKINTCVTGHRIQLEQAPMAKYGRI